MTVSLQVFCAPTTPGNSDRRLPTRVVLDHVTSKWGVLGARGLADGTLRWGELRREVDGSARRCWPRRCAPSSATVSCTARHPEIPPRVEYSLTARGRELCEAMAPLLTWVVANADAVLAGEPGQDGSGRRLRLRRAGAPP